MRSECFHIYGQAEPPAGLIPLRAGPLTMLYDPASGMLRRIKHGDREVLRGIYAAVRDRNWGTVPGVIHETAREMGEQFFHIEFESLHRQGEIHFVWRGVIHGAADGRIRYEFDGEARKSFLRNRIGFCVLHPIAECAGQQLQVLPSQHQQRGSIPGAPGRAPDEFAPPLVPLFLLQYRCAGILATERLDGCPAGVLGLGP